MHVYIDNKFIFSKTILSLLALNINADFRVALF